MADVLARIIGPHGAPVSLGLCRGARHFRSEQPELVPHRCVHCDAPFLHGSATD